MKTPPPDEERRRHERRELLAAVELRAGDAKLILTVKNISLSGVLLLVNDPSEFPPGHEYELIVFDAFNPERTAAAIGRVVRRTTDSIALAWDDHGDSMWEIAEFLEQRRVGVQAGQVAEVSERRHKRPPAATPGPRLSLRPARPPPIWRLVRTKPGESARWESVDGRWMVISVGTGADLGRAIVHASDGRRQVVDTYEGALDLAKEWRG